MVEIKLEHTLAYEDIAALLKRHAGKLTALEVLAVASNMVGKLVALQDQRVVTAEVAMEVVAKNLEIGNQEVLELLMSSEGRGDE